MDLAWQFIISVQLSKLVTNLHSLRCIQRNMKSSLMGLASLFRQRFDKVARIICLLYREKDLQYQQMFFYNPKDNKLICQIDGDKKSIVAWVDKCMIIHIRVFRMEDLGVFFDRLPASHSKIIYDPVKDLSWIQYEGNQGLTCKDLEDHIKSFNWAQDEEYVVIYKRPLAGFKSFSLPKTIALTQYANIKGIGISKIVGRVNDGVVEEKEGNEAEKCVHYFRSLLQ